MAFLGRDAMPANYADLAKSPRPKTKPKPRVTGFKKAKPKGK